MAPQSLPLPQTHTHTQVETQYVLALFAQRCSLLAYQHMQTERNVTVLVHPIRMCWCALLLVGPTAASRRQRQQRVALRWILSRIILSKWKWNSETARKIFQLKWIRLRQWQHISLYPYMRRHVWSNVSRIAANQAGIANVADLIGIFF